MKTLSCSRNECQNNIDIFESIIDLFSIVAIRFPLYHQRVRLLERHKNYSKSKEYDYQRNLT